mmetsp:Transcript_2408/g.5099  ORF Transcript_2408/g.5099 Transcript_2408/m.5099 type:complete len:218 (-) Transcript_2408:802-1455(-)
MLLMTPARPVPLGVLLDVFHELPLLPLQARGLLLVHVLEHAVEGGGGLRLRGRQGLEDVDLLLVPDLLHPFLPQPPLPLDPEPVPLHGVVLLPPPFDLGGGTVAGGVVGGGVVADSVAHGLDQHGARLLNSDTLSLSRSCRHRQQIIPIHPNRVHAVPFRPAYDAVPPVLVVRGGGDREAVVPAYEEGGGLEGGREVQGGVEVTLGGGAVAEVYAGH